MITGMDTITLIHSVIKVNIFYKRKVFRIYMLHVDGQINTGCIIGAVVELNVTLYPMS